MSVFDRKALIAALSKAYRAVARTDIIWERTHFWLTEKYVYAFDGGLGLQLLLPADAPACGVPGKTLLDLLWSSPLERVSLELDEPELTLKLGKAKVKLAVLNHKRMSWPFPDNPDGGEVLEITDEVVEAFKRASIAKASKAEHLIHQGIAVAGVGKSRIAISATNHKTIVFNSIKQKNRLTVPVLLPWAFVNIIVAGLITTPAQLHILPDCLFIEGDGILACSTRVAYPDDVDLVSIVDGHLKANSSIVSIPGALLPVLERACIIGGGAESSSIFLEARGKTLFAKGKWPSGSIEEAISLDGDAGEASGTFLADSILKGVGASSQLALGDRSVVLTDDAGEFVYITAAKMTDSKQRIQVEAEDGDEPVSGAESAPRKKASRGRYKAA